MIGFIPLPMGALGPAVGRAKRQQVTCCRALTPPQSGAARFVSDSGVGNGLAAVVEGLEKASIAIADRVERAGLDGLFGLDSGDNASGDQQKKLDVIANDLMKQELAATGVVSLMASEEESTAVNVHAKLVPDAESFCVVFDPLDGSRNIDASIPTGAIFGVYRRTAGLPESDALLPGRTLVLGGYALFSSATMLVITTGRGVNGFTLDRVTGDNPEFRLTHKNILIPERGQIYSVNDARYGDWSHALRNYIDDVRRGQGETGKKYSARYICSLVADFHRTLLYGGVAMNPRSHLRLVYEANPLSFVAEQAQGKGTNGVGPILDLEPEALHQRLPLFLGSPLDIAEMQSYGDIRQTSQQKYDV